MIKIIEFDNYHSEETLKIDLGAPEKSGLWVKSIKGIGPGKANINVTDLASSDGGIFNSSKSQVRNITLTIGIIATASQSVEDVRRNSYRFFGKKRPIRMIIHTDRVSLYTDGYVESNEPDIFNKQETMAISIICPDPNFYNISGESEISFSSSDSAFEFPMEFIQTTDTSFQENKLYYERYLEDEEYYYYLTADQEMVVGKTYYEEDVSGEGYSNEVDVEYFITEDTEFKPGKEYFEQDTIISPLDPSSSQIVYTATADKAMAVGKTYYEYQNNTEFAIIHDVAKRDVEYYGEIDVGVTIVANISDNVTGFHIYKLYEEFNTYEEIAIDDQAFALAVGSGISPGDVITICTTPGKKYATVRRGADVKNIMNALGKSPDWFMLNNGINTFTFSATTGESFISLDIIYNPAYEGV